MQAKYYRGVSKQRKAELKVIYDDARKIGENDFALGRTSVPVHSPDYCEFEKGLSKEIGQYEVIAALDGWANGWHTANANAAWEDFENEQ